MGYAGEASASKALGYYRLAAEGGEATAALRLGQAFLMGQMGASRHPSMALHWFETAQKLGNPEAALNVGSLYYYRLVMPHATNTLGKAVQAWSDAAKGGSIDAVKHLTHYFDPHTPSRVIHPRGLDIQAENPHEALKWYQVGALYHDLEAMWHLHLKLKQHQPSATSRLQAQAWLNAAAWEGLGKAQYTLAHQAMTQHNLKEAYVWASLAVAHGERQGYSLKQTLEQTLKQNPAQWQQVLESYRQRFTTIYQRIQSIKALQEETKSS
jgi:TPR repeat protein